MYLRWNRFGQARCFVCARAETGLTLASPALYLIISTGIFKAVALSNLTRRYFYDVLGGWGDYPAEAPGWLCDSIVLKHLLGNSMLCILSLQDWLSINEEVRYPEADAERINVPANPRHYWRYRMHITIEDLMQRTALNDRIRDMIGKSGRMD